MCRNRDEIMKVFGTCNRDEILKMFGTFIYKNNIFRSVHVFCSPEESNSKHLGNE
jgi:hypothetical protein